MTKRLTMTQVVEVLQKLVQTEGFDARLGVWVYPLSNRKEVAFEVVISDTYMPEGDIGRMADACHALGLSFEFQGGGEDGAGFRIVPQGTGERLIAS